jgi:basic membrane lipoprotein Med (substrate-binding protein (PBP1-ABC) superfamily)
MKLPRLLAVLPLLALAGCNSGGQTAATNTADANTASGTAAKSDFKVALLTSDEVNDQGWNQLAYEGLQGLQKDLGVHVQNQVTKKPSERQPAMRDLAEDGTNLILLHGFEFGNDALAVAPKYENTKFVVVAGNVKQAPNVATLVPKLEDATYLTGMAAAAVSKTEKVGMVGGMKLDVIQSTFDAFAAGAKAANPKVEVLAPKFVGDFVDQNKGKELSRALIAEGADVILQNADQAGRGVFTAAEEATKGGNTVYVIGSNRNQNEVDPDITLGSAVIALATGFDQVTKSVQNGTFKPEFIELNLGNGGITVEWNDKLKSKIPAATLKKIDAATADIKSGKLKIKRNVK